MSIMLGVTSAQELLGSMVSRLQRPIWVKALRDAGLPESEVQNVCDASRRSTRRGRRAPSRACSATWSRAASPTASTWRHQLRHRRGVRQHVLGAVHGGERAPRLGQRPRDRGRRDTMNDIFMYMCFSKTPALSPSGDCRPFSDQADGTMLGEGMGMVALKRLRTPSATATACTP
jgi:hypothetical protein